MWTDCKQTECHQFKNKKINKDGATGGGNVKGTRCIFSVLAELCTACLGAVGIAYGSRKGVRCCSWGLDGGS